MRQLRLHREIYRGEAVDEAVKVYGKYATFDLKEEQAHWLVEITSSSPARERRIADELANYALGLTIRDRRRAG
ncbi:MAG: HxsD-like protein [Sandaracinaceae bacterium]|nr:HxsD-like protein [Sandaracinaceae bacterium]